MKTSRKIEAIVNLKYNVGIKGIMATKGEIKILIKESARWQSLGIVSKAQATRIRSLYAGKKDHEEVGSKIVPYLAVFGSLMIGAGIILFFALNWATIPKWVKVFSIFAAMIASYHIGYTMKSVKGTHPKVGSALIFLGTLIFGAGIWLIAQIFNISAHWPLGFLYWAIGALLVAYTVQSISSLYVGLIALCGYVIAESAYWFSLIPYSYHMAYSFFLIVLALGIGMYALGTIHERKEGWERMRYPHHLLGALLILGALFFMSFKVFSYESDSWNAIDAMQQRDVLLSSQFWTIFLVVSLVSALALIVSFRTRGKSKADFYEAFFPALLLVFAPLSIVFANINFWAIPILFNIVLFLAIIATIYLGLLKKEPTLVNLGMLAFGVAVIARYFEYLWDVLGGYLFFIIGGLLLIGISILLERKRRDLISHIS